MANEVQGSPENYKGMYAGLKFPAFRHQEYPKLIYRDEARTQLLGTANNAMEEKDLYASIGVEKGDVDPLGAMQDELAMLKAKLAQYEGNDPKLQLAAKTGGVKTKTVEMLKEEEPEKPAEPPTPDVKATLTAAATNPLLKK